MKNIVACVDFSKSTSAVIETAVALATALRTKLYLLNVVVIPGGVGLEALPTLGETPNQRMHRARAELNALREPLLEHGLDIATILLEETGGVVRPIVDEIQRIRAGLVVMGSHGHGALHRMLVGSTAEGVLRQASCPVVVVPSRLMQDSAASKGRAAAAP